MPPRKKKKKRNTEPVINRKPDAVSRMDELKDDEEQLPTIFHSLPGEVLSVASNIGLRTNVPRCEVDSLVAKLASESSKDIGMMSYSCNKTQEKVIEYFKITREKRHKLMKKKKIVKLTSKERKKLFNVDKTSCLGYGTFQEINEIWKGYMTKITEDMRNEQDQLKLLRADYHGADLSVFSSKNPALVGLNGIVVQETKLTFKLITNMSKVSIIPKIGTVFSFKLNNKLYKLNGSCINFSPHHRSRIKVKCRKYLEEF